MLKEINHKSGTQQAPAALLKPCAQASGPTIRKNL